MAPGRGRPYPLRESFAGVARRNRVDRAKPLEEPAMIAFFIALSIQLGAQPGAAATPWSSAIEAVHHVAAALPAPAPVIASPALASPAAAPATALPAPPRSILDPVLLANLPLQTRLGADAVVGKVQDFYKGTRHLVAKFRQTVKNNTFGRTTVSDGKVYIKKPGKMRWDYYSKKNPRQQSKSFISNGETLWAVMHQNLQYYKKPLKDDLLPVAITFLTGDGDLRADFKASLETTKSFGKKGDYVLKLTPRQPNAQYKTLWLVVDPKTYRVKESVVLNANGDTNQFRFFEADTKTSVRDSWFLFNEKAPAARKYRLVNPPKQ
jgi:outer membrane lipoprotein carrier protein